MATFNIPVLLCYNSGLGHVSGSYQYIIDVVYEHEGNLPATVSDLEDFLNDLVHSRPYKFKLSTSELDSASVDIHWVSRAFIF